MGTDSDALTMMIAERSCERLIVEFVRRLDLGEPSTVAELFTPDGVWEWPDGNRRIQGREALSDYFGSRPSDRLSRRLCTNILVTITTPETATATTYFTTYRTDGHFGGMIPPQPPVNVGHYEDTFRKLDETWLLANRTTHIAYGGPTQRLDHATSTH